MTKQEQYFKKPKSSIEKEYASILVYEMATINDGSVLANSAYKLRQLDTQLKNLGLRAKIIVETEKIE